jgi:hypothetical protein
LASKVVADACVVAPAITEPKANDTATDATGIGLTVMIAVAILVSLTAAMVATPGETAMISPLAETVATPGASVLQSTVRLVSARPLESTSVAVAWVVCPEMIELAARERVMVATGACVTVSCALPLFPSVTAVAVMVVVPTAIAVTTPCVSTVAMPVLLELHVTARPVRTPPLASRVVSVACALPTAVIEPGVRLTATVATGATETLMAAVPLFPSLLAVIVVVPASTAVTRPFASTLAIAGWLELHVTTRPESRPPLPSLVVAVSCRVGLIPTMRLTVGGFTETLATGTRSTLITGVDALAADSLDAVIKAAPIPVAVTFTIAPLGVLTELEALSDSTAGSLEIQFTVRPERLSPAASLGVPVNCCVCPNRIGFVRVDSASDATGTGVTVRVATPAWPPVVPRIGVDPGATAVTDPVAETVATAGSSEVQAITRSVNTLPAGSRTVAVA